MSKVYKIFNVNYISMLPMDPVPLRETMFKQSKQYTSQMAHDVDLNLYFLIGIDKDFVKRAENLGVDFERIMNSYSYESAEYVEKSMGVDRYTFKIDNYVWYACESNYYYNHTTRSICGHDDCDDRMYESLINLGSIVDLIKDYEYMIDINRSLLEKKMNESCLQQLPLFDEATNAIPVLSKGKNCLKQLLSMILRNIDNQSHINGNNEIISVITICNIINDTKTLITNHIQTMYTLTNQVADEQLLKCSSFLDIIYSSTIDCFEREF